MSKTIQEINEKIKKGSAVVVTAEEIIDIVHKKGPKKAAAEVDVVTTGTFGPMCSSGAYFNLGHTKPRIKIGGGTCTLNDVPCYTGLAAVDVILGATAMPDYDQRNAAYPGSFKYGGAHVIEELVAGKAVKLSATAYGTDCYPRKSVETMVYLADMNEAVLFDPRNCYQNYNVAVNCSDKVIYTYMGRLLPRIGNANYCSAGQLSPLLNDPLYKTIGIGTRIFLGGGQGYVSWQGTQHNPNVKRSENGVPRMGSGTLAVMGDLKQMSPEWLRGASMTGYGVTLTVGIGVPIPVLNEEIVQYTAVRDEEIFAQVIDYSKNYPEVIPGSVAEVNYAQLKSGSITLEGRQVPTGGLSSYVGAQKIAATLKQWIVDKKFYLSEPAALLPSVDSGISIKLMADRPVKK
jgi:L-aspartate semialdehyde sulfurtransferase